MSVNEILIEDFVAKMQVHGYSAEQAQALVDLCIVRITEGILPFNFYIRDAWAMVRTRGYDYALTMLTPKGD